uniref:Ceramide synthase 5 n=2 Tax=Iconisemion striatum TaxID=60296 RepID=A0A1A7WGI8_9TELE
MQRKFCESMWRFTFYLVIFMYAMNHLWVSPWMWDVRQCWHNYPFQPLSPQQYNYYVAELAFYWSLMVSQFTDVKRKDFVIMFVHHLATILLITFSYANNMLRAGTLVMCVHDASDIFLETLHIIWFYLITRIAIKAIFKGKVAKDDRSDIESSSEEEVCSSNGKSRHQTSKPTDNHSSDLNGEAHDR